MKASHIHLALVALGDVPFLPSGNMAVDPRPNPAPPMIAPQAPYQGKSVKFRLPSRPCSGCRRNISKNGLCSNRNCTLFQKPQPRGGYEY